MRLLLQEISFKFVFHSCAISEQQNSHLFILQPVSLAVKVGHLAVGVIVDK
jgi:hypothetical protein